MSSAISLIAAFAIFFFVVLAQLKENADFTDTFRF